MSLKHNIVAQFKHPHGFMGYLAGFIMANRPSNIERNEWTLDLLELKPTDHLLEIGFGPGIAIEKASQIITEGLIVGIDHSEAMLHQAKKRNAVAIQHGAVRLHLGSMETLSAFDRTFDKICSANVVQFWDDPVAVFKKLRALLTPSGVIVTTYMPRNSGARDADAYAKAKEVVKQLEEAGFSSIRVEERKTLPVSTVSILAVNDVAQH
jgi:ubiquinone/menaquinone biosynthesis C-methylase UbiE